MVSYPVRVPFPTRKPKALKGLPPSIVNELRVKIEEYINGKAKVSSTTVLNYYEIAKDAGIDEKIVKVFLNPLSGSPTGITINNRDFE